MQIDLFHREFLWEMGVLWGFPGGSDSKESTCNAGDLGSIPGWADALEKEMATHSSILAWRIPVDRGAWWATVHGVAKSQTRLKQFSMQKFPLHYWFFVFSLFFSF